MDSKYKSLKTEIIKKAGKEFGESLIDSFLDSLTLGMGSKFRNLYSSISDKMLLIKLYKFIEELYLKTEFEKKEFKDKYFKNEDYQKIGSQLILIIDKADSEKKIKWLARCFRKYIDGKINKQEFSRLSMIISSCFPDDIENIIIFKSKSEIISNGSFMDSYILNHLFSIGLLENLGFDGGNAEPDSGGYIYALNNFGKIMLDIIE